MTRPYTASVVATIMVPVRVMLDAKLYCQQELQYNDKMRILKVVAQGGKTTEGQLSLSLDKIIDIHEMPILKDCFDDLGEALELSVEEMIQSNNKFEINDVLFWTQK